MFRVLYSRRTEDLLYTLYSYQGFDLRYGETAAGKLGLSWGNKLNKVIMWFTGLVFGGNNIQLLYQVLF